MIGGFRGLVGVITLCEIALLAGLLQLIGGSSMADSVQSCTACLHKYQSFRDDYERTSDLALMCKRVEITRECLSATRKHSRRCRSNIELQVFRMGFQLEVKKYKCDMLNETLASLRTGILLTTTNPPRTESFADGCRFRKRSRNGDEDDLRSIPRLCGLFGDPHLQTFTGESQTCVVNGAWPLLDSEYLSIQVTNVKLADSQSATATSKITILLKDSLDSCAQQKIYQVTSGNMPLTFIDGTVATGPQGCQARIYPERQHSGMRMEICHLNATIVIRPVGKYLTFSLRIPDELVRPEDASGLCVSGCPLEELIDYGHFFEAQSNAVERVVNNRNMLSKDAFILCERANLTDFYFDSCLFDLMTTGDQEFAKSAHTAMTDALSLNPKLRLARDNSVALRKRSNFISGFYDSTSSQSSALSSLDARNSRTLLVAGLVLLITYWWRELG